ncbi:MAG: hypothetical protein KL787_03380 [Taibaiella sp.]|nr:hypothetical protein [Taibaiella sp.]
MKFFDFSIIPVELISGIYEALIDEDTRKLHSAVYTPLFLVEYILTNTVDKFFVKKKNKNLSECKIFDPSVGSGIFLVQAFRRMIDREVDLKGGITKNRLRQIAKENLFGIDINRQALKVTCFSIYIAMLDYQDPATITDNFKFPELIDTNLFEADFFDIKAKYNNIIQSKDLDFILGNPPWKRDKSKPHLNWVNSQDIYSNKIKGTIEIAQNFLLRTKDFMQSNTISSLIVTSTIFYNVSTTTKEFKNKFLTTFLINDFFDLSPVKQSLFEQQESPTSIVSYKLSENEIACLEKIIHHKSLKPNLFLKYFNCLVLEKNDYKQIKQRHFIENDWMFKVALYGNVLDFSLVKKIKQKISKPLIELIDNKLLYGKSGILVGNKKNRFPFLEGLPLFENNDIQEYFSKSPERKITLEETQLEAGRELENFDTAKILIKEQAKDWSKIVVSLNETSAVYKKGVFGLSSYDISLLKRLYAYLISELYTYYIFSISGGWGIATHPQIKWKEEFLSFPYIELSKSQSDKIITLVDKFIEPYKNHYQDFNLGEPQRNEKVFKDLNDIINGIYNLENYEQDLISYVLDISRYQFQESKIDKVIRKVHDDHEILKNYIDVFVEQFKELYKNEYLQVEVNALDYFIAMNFVFTKEKPKRTIVFNQTETDEKKILKILSDNLTISKISEKIFIQKDIKGFEENSFYIIKPNEYKCWHRAMAWYDVAEIKKTIEDAEIEYLKDNFDDK